LSIGRRWNGRITSYATISATKSIGKNRPIEIRNRDRVEYNCPEVLKKLSRSGSEVDKINTYLMALGFSVDDFSRIIGVL